MNALTVAAKQRKQSIKVYGFEDLLFEFDGCETLKRRMPIAQLQLCAGYVWAREGEKRKCPVVRPKAKNDFSQWHSGASDEGGTIYLTPKHRNLGGLLHEMAHALGRKDKYHHGPAFVKRCLRLYSFYGDWDGRVA